MKLKQFSILLTSSVGGTDTNWRNRFLGKAILAFERIKEPDSCARFSHAEKIVSDRGHTFAARWRTRERKPEKGLLAYIGAYVMIIEPVELNYVAEMNAYQEAKKRFDGDIYPVWRLLMQGVSAFVLPWIVKIGSGGNAICSEVVAFIEQQVRRWGYWKGVTPAMLENAARRELSTYRIAFEGTFMGLDADGHIMGLEDVSGDKG